MWQPFTAALVACTAVKQMLALEYGPALIRGWPTMSQRKQRPRPLFEEIRYVGYA